MKSTIVQSLLLTLPACNLSGDDVQGRRWRMMFISAAGQTARGDVLYSTSFKSHRLPREGSTSTGVFSFISVTAVPNPSRFSPLVRHLRQSGLLRPRSLYLLVLHVRLVPRCECCKRSSSINIFIYRY